MKSSTGSYFVGLDHIRALAALMVFSWHFSAVNLVTWMSPTVPLLSLFTEGHVGVALFMTLSGYLFAKLLEGRKMSYPAFLWNRAVRLFPLLFLVFFIAGVMRWYDGKPTLPYLQKLLSGFIYRTWPNGGWSVTVELHFYILLPLLLLIAKIRAYLIILVVIAAVIGRYVYWSEVGTVQLLAYGTIIGGIDQFVFGILAFKYRALFVGRHALAFLIGAAFVAFFHYFDRMGGFSVMGEYPTKSPIWIYYPTVVGMVFGSLIAWYDGSFQFQDRGMSGVIAKMGACSYSIYLLHFFIVHDVARLIDLHLFSLTNPTVTALTSFVAFLAFFPVAYASFKWIEMPPMVLKRSYLLPVSKP